MVSGIDTIIVLLKWAANVSHNQIYFDQLRHCKHGKLSYIFACGCIGFFSRFLTKARNTLIRLIGDCTLPVDEGVYVHVFVSV